VAVILPQPTILIPFHEAAAVDHHDDAAGEAEDEFDVVLDEKDRKVLRQAGNNGEKARRFRGAARRPRAHRAAAPSAWSHINSKRSDAISTPVREAEIVAENPAGNTGEPEQPEAATACPPGLSGIVSTPVAPEADTGDYVDGPIHVTNEDGFQPLR
jgi:hypothetical protein